VAQFAIRAFVGPNSAGKTFGVMQECVIPAWKRGRVVLSNTHMFPEALGYPAGLFVHMIDLRSFADCPPGAVIYFGEITTGLPARNFADVSADVVRRMKQLRKKPAELVWDSPSWEDADVSLRRVTQAVTVCEGKVPDPWLRKPGSYRPWRPFGERVRGEDGKYQRVGRWQNGVWVPDWPNKCLLIRRTYAKAQIPDEFTHSKIKGVRPKGGIARAWRPRDWQVGDSYDTLEEVDLFSHIDRAGICSDCGGKKSVPQCKCDLQTRAGITG
jgi:hypothetical protein